MLSESRHGQHLDARAVQSVAIDDRAARFALRRDIPTLKGNAIARVKVDPLELHAVRNGSLPVVRVGVVKAASGSKVRKEPRNKEKKEITITTKIAEGEPAQSICELVNNNKIDLIIMPSVSASGLKIGKMLGSVIDHVCHTILIPILLIKPQHAQLTTKQKLFTIF